MPNSLTHIYGADCVLTALEADTAKVCAAHKNVYLSGSYATDIFFGFFGSGSLKRGFGSFCHHNRIFETISNTAEYLRNLYANGGKNDALLAYFYGYLTHYGLDRTVHAWVYDYVKNASNNSSDKHFCGTFHTSCETEMDLYIALNYLDNDSRKVNTARLVRFDKEVNTAISDFYLSVNADILGKVLTQGEIKTARRIVLLMAQWFQRKNVFPPLVWLVKFADKGIDKTHRLITFLRPKKLNTEKNYLNFDRIKYPVNRS
ncbi:MAG: zinc dependent phospholipase C family protein, partial [Christensenellaceae bacterium]|nr:zinc dependent phospholipase C family protein [Christensenellaceae bacterium]